MYLVCGEALVDVFASPSDDFVCPQTAARVGGSPLNVAIGLARAGRDVSFLSQISTDMFGQQLMGLLNREGVRTQYIQRVNLSTTLSVVGRDGAGQPDYAFYTMGADSSLTVADVPVLSDAIKVIHVGSYSLVAGTTGDALLHLLARDHKTCFTALDPNIRLNVVPDVARWRDQLAKMLPFVRMVKASDEDLMLLYGADCDEATVIEQWLGYGPDLIVITKGAAGATVYRSGGQKFNVAGVTVDVVDTVGAGDRFQATLLDHLALKDGQPQELTNLSDSEIAAAVQKACDAAAKICQQEGAL